jgi:hypothetical protein
MPFKLNDWFCMKPERLNFKPRIPEDAGVIFCHDQILNDEILASIQAAFAKSEPVKMLLYGDWGVGKTHLLYHVQYWLKQDEADYPATPVIIEIGDLTKVSRFDEVVRPFLDRLGLDAVIQLVHSYRGVKPNVTQALVAAGVSSQVAEAFSKLLLASPGSAPPQAAVMAFDYLKGPNKGKAGAAAGLSEPLTQSQGLYAVLKSLGKMHATVNVRQILFIADEGAKLEDMSHGAVTERHWSHVNRLIFAEENRSFGFIYTAGFRRSVPLGVFGDSFGEAPAHHLFELPNLGPSGVDLYLSRLKESFVDRARAEAIFSKGTAREIGYYWEMYPFTARARAEFVGYFSRHREAAKPRDISKKLDDVAFVAGQKGKRLIDSDCLAGRLDTIKN